MLRSSSFPTRGRGFQAPPPPPLSTRSPARRPLGTDTYLCGSARARAAAGGRPGPDPGAPAGAGRPAASQSHRPAWGEARKRAPVLRRRRRRRFVRPSKRRAAGPRGAAGGGRARLGAGSRFRCASGPSGRAGGAASAGGTARRGAGSRGRHGGRRARSGFSMSPAKWVPYVRLGGGGRGRESVVGRTGQEDGGRDGGSPAPARG